MPVHNFISGGGVREHSGTRNPQRGSNAQPGGMARSGGTVPSMVPRGSPRSVFRLGTAWSSSRV